MSLGRASRGQYHDGEDDVKNMTGYAAERMCHFNSLLARLRLSQRNSINLMSNILPGVETIKLDKKDMPGVHRSRRRGVTLISHRMRGTTC